MSTNDFLPREDTQLQLWLTNFKTVATANESVLDLTADELLAINAGTADFNTKMTALEAAKKAQSGATSNKNGSKSEISSTVRGLARKFKANPNVSEGLLNSLGVLANGTTGPVVTVNGVEAMGCDDGVNTIKFNRNGNVQGTTFVIEYKVQGSSVWLFGNAITKTTWNHEGQTPGQQIWYRITSARAGQRSAPSVPVSVYPNTTANPLTIAA